MNSTIKILQRFFDIEFCGIQEEIEDDKEINEFRGCTEYIFKGKFTEGETQQFNVRFNCTSQCQVPIIGPRAKLLITFSAFTQSAALGYIALWEETFTKLTF